jgi:hypothetical protein
MLGTFITDDLVTGYVTGEGTMKYGRDGIPCWRVIIASGHERGKESLMLKSDARVILDNQKLAQLFATIYDVSEDRDSELGGSGRMW